jgi:hypothetical protein
VVLNDGATDDFKGYGTTTAFIAKQNIRDKLAPPSSARQQDPSPERESTDEKASGIVEISHYEPGTKIMARYRRVSTINDIPL